MDNVNRLESMHCLYIRTGLLSLHHCCMVGEFGIVWLLLFTIFLQPHNVLRKFRCEISLRNINLMTVL